MSLQDYIEQIQSFDYNDPEKIGVWPMPVRVALWLLVFAVLIGGTWWFFIRDMNLQYQVAQQREAELRSDFEIKAFEAANLEDYRAQMIAMDEQFQGLLARLPTDIQLPGLLDDISEKAEDAGLVLSKNEFNPETQKEFIIEKPLDIVVRGNTYHDLGGFVSGIAGMPRIVTLHDFNISPVSGGGSSGLQMNITAKTYRYSTQDK